MTGPRPSRRIPLWATLVPLLLGIGAWYLAWSEWRDRLEAAVRDVLPPGTLVHVGGFPYRLEARTGPVALAYRDVATEAALAVDSLVVNRQPWRVDRQVLNLASPRLRLAIPRLAGLGAEVEAPSAQASLRFADGRVARASAVFEDAVLRLGFVPVPVRAAAFEAHVRETPAAAAGAGAALPVQAQLVLSGRDVRMGRGDPVSVSAAIDLAASGPVRSVAAWAAGGTAEVRELVIADGTGEVARLEATLSPGADGRVLLAGTIETVCPATVRAALAGLPPVTEKRTRKPVRLAMTGVLGALAEVAPPPAGAVPPPVRAQAPDCPRLR